VKQKIISAVFTVLLIFLFQFSFSQANTNSKDSTSYEFQGKILSKNADIVTVQQTDSSRLPVKNIIGMLSKYFEKVLFGANITGWLDVGKMKVTATNKGIVTMKLLEEKSMITIDGKQEDHFQPGFVVKFIWKEKNN
jgi:hypothetical protein